jgi:O-antigen ligase
LLRLVKVLLLAGAAASAIAIGLWLMPDEAANSALNILQRLGYPGGWVIRYIEENPALAERAIGTSVDPNVLGGLLLMIGALAGPQLVTKQPLFTRRVIVIIAGLIYIALILTFSRSAMLGLAAGLLFVTAVRYRRLLPYMAVAALLLLLLPVAQEYVGRFVEGIQGQDLATQMRFGEYKDAITLIQRYPVFGVGFAGTPDIDLYLGVANVYLTIAQVMGFIGLLSFFSIVVTIFGYAFFNRDWFKEHPQQDAVWLGLHAALVGALVAGFFDHYLFNLEFHHAVTAFWMIVGLAVASTYLGAVSFES